MKLWQADFQRRRAYNQNMDEDTLPAEVAQALERGATVVTGNRRAARTLAVAFDRRQRALGLKSWQPPAVLAWEAWTAELWQRLLVEGHVSKMLLNRTQEHSVWREILATDAELRSLRTVDSLRRWRQMRGVCSAATEVRMACAARV